MRIQIALNTGGKSFFLRYLKFSQKSVTPLTFKELFPFEDFFEVARERFDAVRVSRFRNEERSRRFDLRSVSCERFPQKPFDSVSFNALSIFFSHAYRVLRFLGRKIYERYRLRKRSLSAFEHFFDIFTFFQTETALCHFRYAETCFLPLFLRRLMTFLPPVVFMRLRNPCTLLLCLFLG